MINFIYISPTFPKVYYQFPLTAKKLGVNTLGIAEDSYESLSNDLKEALCDYYQVSSLENYDEVYKAVAYFAYKYGKIDYLESNNEYWLSQDARLRTDFNINSSYNTEDLYSFKFKSGMKKFYKDAGVKVARYALATDLEDAKKFIKNVGYPIVLKPDNGVGANATYKISNENELMKFFNEIRTVQYIMEEYLVGTIVSYDGIVGNNSEIIFETAHLFTTPVMDIVNDAKDCVYYTLKDIPDDLKKLGHEVIKSFKPRNRFFHCEFFRLDEDKNGLAKKGELIGLEVNMRPPGGYTTDMMNFACDIDVYHIYAETVKYGHSNYNTKRPYVCVHVGRRFNIEYAHDFYEISEKYKDNICMYETMPKIISDALGDELIMARFKEEKEMNEFISYSLERKK